MTRPDGAGAYVAQGWGWHTLSRSRIGWRWAVVRNVERAGVVVADVRFGWAITHRRAADAGDSVVKTDSWKDYPRPTPRPDPCMTMPPGTDYPSAVWGASHRCSCLLRGEKTRASCPIDCDDSTASCIHRGMSDDEVARVLGRTRSIRSERETGRG